MDKHHQHLHISRHLHLRRFLHDKYNDFVIADTLRHMALAMISLFVPIFLLELGFSIMAIVLLELMMCVTSVGVHFFAVKYIPRWGVKKTLIISYVLNILFYIILYQSTPMLKEIPGIIYLIIVGVVNVAASAIYWTAHHIYFFKTTSPANAGTKVGILFSVIALAGIASPFLGGILITNFGFHTVFFISALMLVAASGALFFSRNIKVKKSVLKIKKILDIEHLRKNAIYFIQGIGFCATAFVWPLFLFFASLSIASIGLLYLISNLVYSALSFYSGRIDDRWGNRKMVTIGSIGHGLSLVFRALSTTVFTMTAFQTMGGTFGSMLHIPLEAGFYKYSYSDYYNAILNREFYMYAGRIFILIIFIIALWWFGIAQAMVIVLILAGASTFSLCVVIQKDKSIIS